MNPQDLLMQAAGIEPEKPELDVPSRYPHRIGTTPAGVEWVARSEKDYRIMKPRFDRMWDKHRARAVERERREEQERAQRRAKLQRRDRELRAEIAERKAAVDRRFSIGRFDKSGARPLKLDGKRIGEVEVMEDEEFESPSSLRRKKVNFYTVALDIEDNDPNEDRILEVEGQLGGTGMAELRKTLRAYVDTLSALYSTKGGER